ncbi:MAG: glycosyltransferase [Polyangiaceae bacterium]|nr:glycosyltransferase [Polyangiaceae bacterium]
MHVLHVAPAFFPATAYGGPTFSLMGLCDALARAGVSLEVICTDAAGPRRNVSDRRRHFPAGYEVRYCGSRLSGNLSPILPVEVARAVPRADLIHMTGVYTAHVWSALVATRITGKPMVWSPRGALQRWDGTSRRSIKDVWDRLARGLATPSRTILHATSADEARQSELRFPELPTVVIPNGVELPPLVARRDFMPAGTLRVMYLGRLHPIKALPNLVRAIALSSPGVLLDVYGDGDSTYRDELLGLVRELGLERSVTFHGAVGGADKSRAFLAADVCVLPSHSENFGMAIAEALAHGIPVVASTGTPWSELDARGVGRWVENAPEQIAAALSDLRHEDLGAMGRRARAWMEAEFSWDALATRMLAVYASLLRKKAAVSHAKH